MVVSWAVNGPCGPPPIPLNVPFGFVAMGVAEACNLWCHLKLASLRKPGQRTYSIPRGLFFDQVVW